jgi:hypothetical protein
MKACHVLLILALLATTAFGGADWEAEALAALRGSNSKAAMKLAQDYSGTKHAKIILFAANAQQYDRSQNSKSMNRAKVLYKELLEEVAVDDAVILHSLRTMPGSVLPSYAETLMDQALQRVRTAEQARAVPDALAVVYKAERYKIFGALSGWLSSQRAQLLQGRELDESTRAVFADERLITALLDTMPAKKKVAQPAPAALAGPKPGAGEAPTASARRASARLPPRTDATARECLVLIEEPAMEHVMARLPELGDDGVSLLSDMCTAKNLRESMARK